MPQDNIEEIKQKIDIVDLLQEYIQMKPAGTNNFKALCPFHHEKTPSFMVSKDKQIWHCFGCGEGGDIFGFIIKMEGMEFPEALRHLAKKAGVELQYQDPSVNNQKTKLLDIIKAAAQFYHKILLDHPKAKFVRDYLSQRGVTEDSISNWQIGFAPHGQDTLNKYLVQKGFAEGDIFLSGLTLKKDRGTGYLDRFRNRLMFPISDVHGNPIGFGGRWLGDEKDVAKYINSPQTLVYNKSNTLYGLDKAKQEIRMLKQAVVVEGYMDCLASHQAGVTNVVASSGTALTENQVRLLKRFTTNLVFAFDQDLAGDAAAKRGIELAWQVDMSTKVILLPDNIKDPDELIKSHPQDWPKVIKKAQSVMEYYFDSTLANMDLHQVEDKKNIAKILLPVITKLADPIEQTHYLQKLSGLLQVNEDVLRDKIKQLSPSSKKLETSEQVSREGTVVKNRFVSIAENLVGIAMTNPQHLNYISAHVLPEHIPDDKLKQLYKSVVIYYTKKQDFDYKTFIKSITDADSSLATYADVLSMKTEQDINNIDGETLKQEVIKGVIELKRRFIQERLKQIEVKIRQAEEQGHKDKVEEFSQRFAELTSELHQVS